MAERQIGVRNCIRSTGSHPATKWTDEVMVQRLQEIYKEDGVVTSGFLGGRYNDLEMALQSRGRRRIFELAGIELPRRRGSRQ